MIWENFETNWKYRVERTTILSVAHEPEIKPLRNTLQTVHYLKFCHLLVTYEDTAWHIPCTYSFILSNSFIPVGPGFVASPCILGLRKKYTIDRVQVHRSAPFAYKFTLCAHLKENYHIQSRQEETREPGRKPTHWIQDQIRQPEAVRWNTPYPFGALMKSPHVLQRVSIQTVNSYLQHEALNALQNWFLRTWLKRSAGLLWENRELQTPSNNNESTGLTCNSERIPKDRLLTRIEQLIKILKMTTMQCLSINGTGLSTYDEGGYWVSEQCSDHYYIDVTAVCRTTTWTIGSVNLRNWSMYLTAEYRDHVKMQH